MQGTWKTTGGGGGAAVGAGLVLFGAAYLLHVATPALAAGGSMLAGLAKLILAAGGTLVALAVTGLVAWRAYRRRHPAKLPPWAGTYRARVIPPSTGPAVDPPASSPPMQALPPPAAHSGGLHLHFHGDTDPARVADAIRRAQDRP